MHELAELGRRIEEHYGSPQDTEWAYDPEGARLDAPVAARHDYGGAAEPGRRRRARTGACCCAAWARRRAGPPGRARVVTSLAEAGELSGSDVLVAHMTTPDWVPLMRRAAAIVTDSGGMTCHAAIVSRELGIPCLVGTGSATETLRDGELVTVDAGKGVVLEGERAEQPAAAARGAGRGSGRRAAGHGHPPAREPVRAVSGRARRRAAGGRRRDCCGPS